MAQKKNLHRTEIESYLTALFDHFKTQADLLHTIWQADDYDHLAANNVTPAKGNGALDALVSIASNTYSPSDEDWKDQTSMAIKARAKYLALVAQMAQTMTQGNQLPVDLLPTPRSDVAESIAAELVFMGVFQDPEVAIAQAEEEAKAQLERCRKKVLDMVAESKMVDTWYRAIEDACQYGVCAIETPVRCESYKRVWRTALEMQPAPDDAPEEAGLPVEMGEDTMQMVPTLTTLPGFEKKVTIKAENISPYDIYLDPTADGDAQKGDAVIRQSRLSYTDLAPLINKDGFDVEVLKEILDDGSADSSQTEATGQARRVQEHSLAVGNNQYEVITYWGTTTRKQIKDWGQSDKRVKNFLKEYDELRDTMLPMDEKDAEDDYSCVSYKAITVRGRLVYLSPLTTVDGRRPIIYHRLIPLKGTNYGFGMYALMRPITQAMTKLWRRAVDNELLVGTTLFAVDPSVIDMSTWEIKPGAVMRYKPGLSLAAGAMKGTGVDQVRFESVSQALLALFDRLDMMADEVSMVPKNMLGVTLSGDQTATESAQNYTSAQTNILHVLRGFDDNVVRETVESLYHYLQADVRSEDNPDGLTAPNETADGQVRAYGAETFMLQLINKRMTNELLQLLPVLEQVAPGVTSSINIPEVIRRVMKGLGFEPDEVMRIPAIAEEIAQLNQQIMELTQMVEQAQAQMQMQAEEQQKSEKELNEARRMAFENKQLADERLNSFGLKLELDRLKEQQKMREAVNTKKGESK